MHVGMDPFQPSPCDPCGGKQREHESEAMLAILWEYTMGWVIVSNVLQILGKC